jgi:hypothetical protein
MFVMIQANFPRVTMVQPPLDVLQALFQLHDIFFSNFNSFPLSLHP